MKVKILKLGQSATEAEMQSGATIEDACEKAGISHHGYSLTLNGLTASSETSVSEGDIVTLVPKVEGGR